MQGHSRGSPAKDDDKVKWNPIFSAAVSTAALLLCQASMTMAQPEFNDGPLDPGIKASFVPLGPGVPGVLYEPVHPGPKAAIAVYVMHAEQDYLRFSACTELSKRGYTVLCANNTAPKGMASLDLDLDQILLDAKRGVVYLHSQPRIKKVVLFGHSGGGALMAAYQSIAENGVKSCQGPEKIHSCSDKLAGLPAADGVILADANWGLASMFLFSIDPAVADETSGRKIDQDLNLFNPSNGYSRAGSDYSAAFIGKFQHAVHERNERIVRRAEERLAAIQAGKGAFADDEPFLVPGAVLFGFNNKLFAEDPKLMSHTEGAYPLLHADGSVSIEVVHTVRRPEGFPLSQSLGGAVRGTVRTFLTTFAVRTRDDFGFDEDSVHGIDWDSSYSTTPGAAKGIHVPLLTMGMTGHWEYLAAETIYKMAPAKDKNIAFVEGASHMYSPCRECEKTPGQYGDTVKTLYDYVDRWISQKGRF